MPLSSWSHIKGLPRRPAIGSCVMERQRPWETFNRHTSAGSFLFFFYLNGVKHLHKWEASQYIDLTKKKVVFPPPQILFQRGKKVQFFFFKPFLYILWDMFKDMDRSHTRPHSPQNSNLLDQTPTLWNKENRNPPQHSKHRFCIFSPLFIFYQRQHLNGVANSNLNLKPSWTFFFFLNESDVLLMLFFLNWNVSPGHRKKTCRDWNINSGFCQRCIQLHQAQSETPA